MDIAGMDMTTAGSLLRDRKISVSELAGEYIKNIREKDPSIGAYLHVCESKTREDIQKAQDMIDRGEASPLAGIPYALKDNICTRGIETTCASRILKGFLPPYNATVADRLDAAGGVLLGKLNMDEFAMGGSTENSAFGITRNPHDKSRVPGGSSGGSAAAVAASMALFTLGSDTGGSIRQPASFCGVTGLKPTYGRVSRYGLVAFASSLDQIGPLGKTVRDCALVMEAIAGHDPMDSTSAAGKDACFTGELEQGIKGMRIAVPREYLAEGISPGVREKVLEGLDMLASMGAVWEEVELKLHDAAISAYYIISSAEASSNLARYDGIKYGFRSDNARDLAELYSKTRNEGFGEEVKRRIMLGTYVLSSGYYDAYYIKALKIRSLIKEEFDTVLGKYDLIAGPTTPTTAFGIGEKTGNPLEMYLGDVYTVSVNIAGLPAVSLPCGTDTSGLPVGFQLIGRAFDEKTLLRCARALEKAREVLP
ncbi:MAG: Asp-tRNA(Asn)/Glu-tRNA(Gln) amidotransferase subunit GatA [Clostridia bacterium]